MEESLDFSLLPKIPLDHGQLEQGYSGSEKQSRKHTFRNNLKPLHALWRQTHRNRLAEPACCNQSLLEASSVCPFQCNLHVFLLFCLPRLRQFILEDLPLSYAMQSSCSLPELSLLYSQALTKLQRREQIPDTAATPKMY